MQTQTHNVNVRIHTEEIKFWMNHMHHKGCTCTVMRKSWMQFWRILSWAGQGVYILSQNFIIAPDKRVMKIFIIALNLNAVHNGISLPVLCPFEQISPRLSEFL